MPDLFVNDIHLSINGNAILKGASFSAGRGTILALLGASGSGKSTLLRCIAGLTTPDRGKIAISGLTAFDASLGKSIAPEKRNIGLVFQSYALWPHRTVLENVTYGLKVRGYAADAAAAKGRSLLSRLGLGELAERLPAQLSGGQQQRVAICRALIYEPKILLLDEPLSNLDAKLREDARYFIRKIVRELGLCAVLVTHDQSEALAVADQIVLLKDGRVLQAGSPTEIYRQPANFEVADFLGTNNVFKSSLLRREGEIAVLGNRHWELRGLMKSEPVSGRGELKAVVRIENVNVFDGPGETRVKMKLEDCLFLGEAWEYRLTSGDLSLRARGKRQMPQGDVHVEISPADVWIFADH